MANEPKKGISVKVDADLHAEISRYLQEHDMTMTEFVTKAIEDELHPKITEGEKIMANTRTIAFQVPEELFQRIKDYLQRNNITQRQFLIDLIEDELEREQSEFEDQSEDEYEDEDEDEDEGEDADFAESEGVSDEAEDEAEAEDESADFAESEGVSGEIEDGEAEDESAEIDESEGVSGDAEGEDAEDEEESEDEGFSMSM